MTKPPIDWENDPVVFTTAELKQISEIAYRHRDQMLDEMRQAFYDRDAYALVAAMAMLFASGMTDDPIQQVGAAGMLNSIMARWVPHDVPWRLVPRDSSTPSTTH